MKARKRLPELAAPLSLLAPSAVPAPKIAITFDNLPAHSPLLLPEQGASECE